MIRKFFPRDKNYILEQAQLSVQQPLLQYLVDFVKVEYLLRHNPLGIVDDATTKIHKHKGHKFGHLDEFYLTLMGIFRYTFYSDNQLSFIFEPKEDFDKYQEEWEVQFKSWVKEFCRHQNFLRAVLDLTVFYPESPALVMDTRMMTFLTNHFELKLNAQKVIVKLGKVANG